MRRASIFEATCELCGYKFQVRVTDAAMAGQHRMIDGNGRKTWVGSQFKCWCFPPAAVHGYCAQCKHPFAIQEDWKAFAGAVRVRGTGKVVRA
jgi:hypothetical protein